jgi:hypothetical protein
MLEIKIKQIEDRIAGLKAQMERLLATPLTPAQREAVVMGHQMTIDEFNERLDALRKGEPDPYG